LGTKRSSEKGVLVTIFDIKWTCQSKMTWILAQIDLKMSKKKVQNPVKKSDFGYFWLKIGQKRIKWSKRRGFRSKNRQNKGVLGEFRVFF
jgi:hypothetical protein